jgi:ParB family transcriptional regulator, chromosome partitioning protein
MTDELSSGPALRKRPTGLGRGLSALMGELQAEVSVGAAAGSGVPDGIRMIDVVNMRPLPNQPRRVFNDETLDELAASITARGMLQPIVVRDMDGFFEIVAGERRWRAAQRAQLHQVPVIVREFDDKTALEIALVENVQREQLNAWEEGETFRRLVDDYGHSQESLAKIVGKSRSHVANLIRLRTLLPLTVHGWLAAGDLTMGHARALLNCEDPVSVARQAIDRHLSVRETESLAKRFKPGSIKVARAERSRDADLEALERQLGDMLGLKVRINHAARGGIVTLGYSSLDQLDMICQRLSGEQI